MDQILHTARAAMAQRRHPFWALPPRRRLPAAGLLATAALVIHHRQRVNAKSPAAPHGTLSFALTGRRDQAEHMRSTWSQRTERRVRANFRLDILFSFMWTNAIALAGLWAADRMAGRQWFPARAGDVLAWAQWAAALFAITKDVEKLASLHDRPHPPLERVGRWATIAEIVTKAAGIAYAAAPAAAWLVDRARED